MFINYRISIDYLLCWTAKLWSCPPRWPFWRQCKKGLLINLTIKRLVYCWCFERRNFVTEKDEMPDEAPSSERKTKCLMKDLPQRERQNAWWMHAFAQNVKTSQSVYRQYTDVLIAANTVFSCYHLFMLQLGTIMWFTDDHIFDDIFQTCTT